MSSYNRLKVEIDSSDLDNEVRRQKAAIVEIEMNKVLNSPEFKSTFLRILLEYDYQLGERSRWADHSPTAIMEHFFNGAETLNPVSDGVFQIKVADYYSIKNVIGYTKKSIETIFTNTRYFDVRQTILIGSNWCHEQGHKLGFSHDFMRTRYRSISLCYLLNMAYEEAYCNVYNFEKVKVPYRTWKTLYLKKQYRTVYRRKV